MKESTNLVWCFLCLYCWCLEICLKSPATVYKVEDAKKIVSSLQDSGGPSLEKQPWGYVIQGKVCFKLAGCFKSSILPSLWNVWLLQV